MFPPIGLLQKPPCVCVTMVSDGDNKKKSNKSGGDKASAAAAVLAVAETGAYENNAEYDALFNKLLRYIVPVPFLITFFCYMDRTFLSVGAAEFMRDVDLSQQAYATGAALFFIPNVLFQLPSNFVLQTIGAPMSLGWSMMGWGICATCMSFVRSKFEFYFLRVMLGAFEAGTLPGIFHYYSLFFPEGKLTIPLGWSLAACSFSMAVSAPIAAGVLMLGDVAGWRGWQWLFVVEGIPGILLGVFTIYYLPKTPAAARFLSDGEKAAIEKEVGSGSRSGSNVVPIFGFGWDAMTIRKIIFNRKLWWTMSANMLCGIMRTISTFWAPLWIQGLLNGHGVALEHWNDSQQHRLVASEVALLTTVPFALAAAVGPLLSWSSNRFKDRKTHAFGACTVSSIAFCMLPIMARVNVPIAFILMSIGMTGAHGAGGPVFSIMASCFSKHNTAFGFALANSVTNVSGYVGPELTGLLAEWTDSYSVPIYVAGGLVAVAGIMFLTVKDDVEEKLYKVKSHDVRILVEKIEALV